MTGTTSIIYRLVYMRSNARLQRRGKILREPLSAHSTMTTYFSNTSYTYPIVAYLSNTSYPQTLAMAEACQAFPAQHQELLRQCYCVVAYIIEQNQTPTAREFEQFILADPNAGYRVCSFHNCPRRFPYTRRQRAIAHIRKHFGYRPYACDGACGVIAWCVPMQPSLRCANCCFTQYCSLLFSY